MEQAERKKIITFEAFLLLCVVIFTCPAVQAGYIDNGDGTVTDNGTGLMWQQAKAPGTYTWEQALAYCENLILNNNGAWTSGTANASGAKYSDWRLPTIKELRSVVDTRQYNPAINTTYFPDTAVESAYCASTRTAYPDFDLWNVNFLNGLAGNRDYSGLVVRAVRSGQAGALSHLALWPVPDTGQTQSYTSTFGEDHDYSINTPSYTKLAAGSTPLPDNATEWAMVRDDVTGLLWEEKHAKDGLVNYEDPNDADNIYSWYDNNSATNGGDVGAPNDGIDTMDFIRTMNTANYGGFSDWRMSTDKELQTIVDYGRYNPSINTTYFPNTVASYYWSSATLFYNSSYAWYVYFYGGHVNYYEKHTCHYVRAVRGPVVNLTISKSGTGTGTVTSDPIGINCGSDCSETYQLNTQVTLTTSAANGSTFAGWSGGCTDRWSGFLRQGTGIYK